MRSNYIEDWPCLGNYDEAKYGRETRYACIEACYLNKECRELTNTLAWLNTDAVSLEELPEYLAHENEKVREAAKVKQQELRNE